MIGRDRRRRGGRRALGLTVTSFSQTLGAELLVNGDFGTAAGWAVEIGWAIGGGVLTGTPVQTGVTYQGGLTLTANAWYEASMTVVRTAGNVAVQLGTGSLSARGQAIASSVSTQELLRYVSGTALYMLFGDAVAGFGGTIDDASLKAITPNPVWTMPRADGTHEFSFTLPGSPKAGQQVQMRYRVQDSANYWMARLRRNAGNTDWDFLLSSVSAGTVTNQVTVTGVGAVDTLRVVTRGSTHTPYTGSGGVFTQRSSATVSHLDTETGITSMYSSAITPVMLTSF